MSDHKSEVTMAPVSLGFSGVQGLGNSYRQKQLTLSVAHSKCLPLDMIITRIATTTETDLKTFEFLDIFSSPFLGRKGVIKSSAELQTWKTACL